MKIAKFWKWFAKNEQGLYSILAGGDHQQMAQAVVTVGKQLRLIHRGLGSLIGSSVPGSWDLIVTADGDSRLFPLVNTIVAGAPKLPRWRVIPFRPRMGADASLSLGGMTIAGSDVTIGIDPGQRPLGVTVMIEGYRPTPAQYYEQIALLLLDHALGEYDTVTKLDIQGFSRPIPMPGRIIVPLAKLPSVVDRYFPMRN